MDHATSQVGHNFEDLKLSTTQSNATSQISINAKFQLFIPFNREDIKYLINFVGILGLNGPRDVTGGAQF